MKKALILLILAIWIQMAFAMRPPELPGVEVTNSEIALEQSQKLVQQLNSEKGDFYENKGWTAPNLEEQMNQDETFVGMGQGAIFVPRFSESRLEPEFKAVRMDTLSKEYENREWLGKHGQRLVVPYGTYMVIMGSGNVDDKFGYEVKVEEGKTTLVPPRWGGLVINTINEDGEFVSENYEIFEVYSGKSYGRGFGLTQERLNDVKTWILQPQIYRISRSGENASSIINYITVQVNPGELSNVELVFDENTGRLIAGGVHKMRINAGKDSHWTYGLRLGGSASYTTLLTASEQKSSAWNALGDLRLRALYNRTKVFWLTELYTRENMQWLNEEKIESQWNISQDLLQFQSSVVYKIFDWIGPYMRANAKTHIFPEYYWIGDTDTDSLCVTSNLFKGEKIRISSSFDPLRIGEGVGLNLQPMVSNSMDISAQTGFAVRQTIRRKILIPTNKAKTVFTTATNESYDYGWENSINVRLSFLRFFTLDLLGEIFFQNARIRNYRIEELSADLRFSLTRYLELSYQQQFQDRLAEGMEEAKGEARFESLNTVQLRLYVNF
ncbi:MAG: DUF3078 domain-containing protein [Fibromonadales bacterium]|nr:DUF3078 domain-containing protein [Fibromonadales bacterium]